MHIVRSLPLHTKFLAHFKMQGEIKERWEQLCQLAAIEQDSEKLMKLIEEINRLLAEKEQRLARQRTASASQS